MLERHGDTYLNALTAELSLIDCQSVFVIGEDAYPVEISVDVPEKPAQQSIRLVTESRELGRPNQEQPMHALSPFFDQTKRVRFHFKEAQRENLAAKCLAKQPSSLYLRCEAPQG